MPGNLASTERLQTVRRFSLKLHCWRLVPQLDAIHLLRSGISAAPSKVPTTLYARAQCCYRRVIGASGSFHE